MFKMKKIITLLKKISPIGIGVFTSACVAHDIESAESGSWLASGDCWMYQTKTVYYTLFRIPFKKIKKLVFKTRYNEEDFRGLTEGEHLIYIYEY
jgi:hypothetical protein